MANPNPNVWGTSDTWEYSINAYGLETETAETANCAKPKCNNFGYTVLTDYDKRVIINLYQPIIGPMAVSLYLTLQQDHKKIDKDRSKRERKIKQKNTKSKNQRGIVRKPNENR